MLLGDQTRLRQNQRVAARVYDGLAEVITLDPPIRQHRLSQVGTRIWELLEHGATIGEVADRLVREYDVDEATASRDAQAFCADLVERGILLVEAGS